MNAAPPIDDELWSAIGDPTRRRVLDLLLVAGPATSTSLSDQLPVTRQAVAKHLSVLQRTGLVRSVSAGRERHYHLDEAQFARALAQLAGVTHNWDARLARIKQVAETIEQATKK